MNLKPLSSHFFALLLVTAASFLFLPNLNSAQAATYYVATNGDDERSCDTAQDINTPKRTINDAVTCLSAGDTLYIRAGTYAEALETDGYPANGIASQHTIISSWQNEVVTLRPPNGPRRAIYLQSRRYIDFVGLILDGVNQTIPPPDPTQPGIQAIAHDVCNTCTYTSSNPDNYTHHITYRNMEIKNWPGYAFSSFGALGCPSTCNTDIWFIGNKIHDVGLSEYGGNHTALYMAPPQMLVEYNEIYNVPNAATIYSSDYNDKVPRDSIFRYNLIHNIGNVHATDTGPALYVSGSNAQVYNNIFYNNFKGGIRLEGPGTNMKVYNNTTYSSGDDSVAGWPYELIVQVNDANIKNNIFAKGPSAGAPIFESPTGSTFSANLCDVSGAQCALVANPLFVNPAARDFHLQSGSPAINTGTTLGAPYNVDFAGTSRPQPPGGAYDIGAYEFVGVSPAITSLRLGVSLERDSRVDQKTFTVKIFAPGGITPLYQTSLNPLSGRLNLTGLNLTPGNYDLRVSAPSHLSRKLFSQNLTQDVLITFPIPLLAGDRNTPQDGIINTLDWSLMNPRWNTNDSLSDLNGDNLTNSLDWSLMNKNWLSTGE